MPSGLVLRLDASTLTYNDEDPVDAWADGSGNSNNASQATATNQPQYLATGGPNGNPTVYFNGAGGGNGSMMTINDAASLDLTAMTVFAVVEQTGTPNSNGFLLMKLGDEYASTVYGYAFMNFGPMNIPFATTESGWGDHNSSISLSTGFHVTNAYYDGSGWAHQIDGTGEGSGSVTGDILPSAGALQLGGYGNSSWSENFKGNISEILLFNRALTTEEISTVNNYLTLKWGLS